MTRRIMIDIKTLGTHHNAAILSIGATGGNAEFYEKISLESVIGVS